MLAFVLSVFLIQGPFSALESTYGFKTEILSADLDVKPNGYSVTAKAPTADQMAKYTPLFLKEWSLYPSSLPKAAKVEKITFGVSLAMNGQFRAAVPAFDLNTMFYDPVLGASSPHYQRIVIHHEFFHMLDWRMRFLDRDREWAKLNAADFHYGSGGDKMRTSGVGELTDTIPGFLTPYGTSAAEEDKAELFAHMIVDPEFVRKRAASDPVLQSKIDLLKARLKKFDPNVGDEFWRQFQSDSMASRRSASRSAVAILQ